MSRSSSRHTLAALGLVAYLLVEQFTSLYSTYPALEVAGFLVLAFAALDLGHLAWTGFHRAE